MPDPTTDVAREDEELRTHDGELRMNAYYYAFGKTGVVEVDRVLAAVACAGKGCHNTEDWSEFNYPELIQRWADKAAKAFREVAAVSRARDEAWREAVEAVRYSLTCDMLGEHLRPCENVECKAIHAALDALLARMDGAK